MPQPRSLKPKQAALQSALTIRASLGLVVAACIVPVALMAAALIAFDYHREQARLWSDAVGTSRTLSARVDAEAAGVEYALAALAGSPYLSAGDLSAFRAQAREVLGNRIVNSLVLSDRSGHQRLNVIFVEPFRDPAAAKPLLQVAVPVRIDGAVRYTLSAGVSPERLSRILEAQDLPPDWSAAVLDITGAVVAQTGRADRFLGPGGFSRLLQRMSDEPEDAFVGTSVAGTSVLTTFSRSSASSWTVAVAVPRKGWIVDLWHPIAWLVLTTAALFGIGLWVAVSVSRRISRSIDRLVEPVLALGGGEPVTIPPLQLKEAHEIGGALERASRLLAEAQHKANHDPLTGLKNRALFEEVLGQQVAACKRMNTRLAVLYIDLDGFKAINDRYGHTIGDEVLCAVATRLRTTVRESDVTARLGGDEFAVALVDAGTEAAAAAASKILETLCGPYRIGNLVVEVSASVGIAAYPASALSRQDLIRTADEAMYAAKKAGHGRFAIESPTAAKVLRLSSPPSVSIQNSRPRSTG